MDVPREFEWDDAKATVNEAKHGVPFPYGVCVFLDRNRLTLDTIRPEDKEARSKVIGTIEGRLFTVVFTMRGAACRIISARRSNRQEERGYANHSLQP